MSAFGEIHGGGHDGAGVTIDTAQEVVALVVFTYYEDELHASFSLTGGGREIEPEEYATSLENIAADLRRLRS